MKITVYDKRNPERLLGHLRYHGPLSASYLSSRYLPAVFEITHRRQSTVTRQLNLLTHEITTFETTVLETSSTLEELIRLPAFKVFGASSFY